MNRYLVSRNEALAGFDEVSWHTVSKAASNLKCYAEWLRDVWHAEPPSRDYLDFGASLRLDRPTYAYLDYVKNLSDLSPATKNHRIATVRSFYEYLDRAGRLPPEATGRFQIQSSANLFFESSVGKRMAKKVRTSDLRIRHSASSSALTVSGKVMDDGEVRPLTPAEISVVLPVLREYDHPIIRLCAFLALNSGARLQSLLTIRRTHVAQMRKFLEGPHPLCPLQVGGNSLIKAKRGTPHTLQIPSQISTMLFPYVDILGNERHIADLIVAYEASEHAQTRYTLAKKLRKTNRATLQSPSHEYLFLGRNGMPYYLDEKDPLNSLRRSARVGGSFKGSISKHVNPQIRAKAEEAGLNDLAREGIGIHDLRGTFAEQALLRCITQFTENGHDRIRSEEMAVRHVQRLLGHTNSTTTYRYLKFRDERAKLFEANEAYATLIFGKSS